MQPGLRIAGLHGQRVPQAGVGRSVLPDEHGQQRKKADRLKIPVQPPKQPAIQNRPDVSGEVRQGPQTQQGRTEKQDHP
ncbi:hypothetical protein D3C81_2208760 [compost metagenome]